MATIEFTYRGVKRVAGHDAGNGAVEQFAGPVEDFRRNRQHFGEDLAGQVINLSAFTPSSDGQVAVQNFLKGFSVYYGRNGSLGDLSEKSDTRLFEGVLSPGSIHQDVGIDQDHPTSLDGATASAFISFGVPTGNFIAASLRTAATRVSLVNVA